MSSKCPHLNNQLASITDIKYLEELQVKSCATCHYVGINLWICLQKNCLRVGCSEQAEDHSAQHFQFNNAHCVHLNLTSYRAWCYVCDREVFPSTMSNEETIEPFIEATSSLYEANTESGTSMGLVGMHNIANTCYMNSALQALSNAEPMTHYFLYCGELVDYFASQASVRNNKAGLAKSYHSLIEDVWSKNDNDKVCLAPRGVLYNIRSMHPMFRGFQQHDTQEFLRCFMDQLHEELKTQRGIPKYIERNEDNRSVVEFSMRSISPESTESEETEYDTCDSSVSGDFDSIEYAGGDEHSNTAADSKDCHKDSSSIISDVFDGKLLSSVQCLTCDRISTREETFQDLSLPIPNRDFLNVLHRTQSLSSQSLNSIDTVMARSNESFFAWMWSVVKSWLWGPSVTLYDCMSSFFSADELKGDNMYSCERCKKLRTGVKYSRIKNLPEMLCIHLKRFRHDLSFSSKISAFVQFPLEGLDLRPYLHKECKSKIDLYNLSSVICHHGTVGGGHYTCFARNPLTNRWYEYDDHRVTEVSTDIVQNCQAYVLFYRKHNPQMDLIRTEARELSIRNPVHLSDIRFYIAREWLSRFYTFAEPGPINNWAILCPHGGLLQSKSAISSKIAVPISQQLWDFLHKKFSGGPSINMLYECEVCKRAAEMLARRQYFELNLFSKYNSSDNETDMSPIFAISMSWLRKWQQFARGNTAKEPGPITNMDIVVASEREKAQTVLNIQHIRAGSDYAQINAPLWRFLRNIYGGGPEIIIRGSTAEEIEIIDQDEYYDYESQENVDYSDTESNIGQKTTNNKADGTSVSEESEALADNKDNSHALSKKYRHISTNSRKIKNSILRGNLRNKHKKVRNTFKNADIFSTKVLLGDCANADSKSNELPTDLSKYSSEKLTSEEAQDGDSGHLRETHRRKKSTDNSNPERARMDESGCYDESGNAFGVANIAHGRRKSRRKETVQLRKYTSLPETPCANVESDV